MRTFNEIWEQIDATKNSKGAKGKTYEEGIEDALQWIMGEEVPYRNTNTEYQKKLLNYLKR